MPPRLDIRWPIGVLWVVLGTLLVAYGVGAQPSAGTSLAVDRWWGATMVLFGVAMLLGARAHAKRSRRRSREVSTNPASPSEINMVEGRDATDEHE